MPLIGVRAFVGGNPLAIQPQQRRDTEENLVPRIFDFPRTRSRNVIGTSPRRSPA